jgi:Holliday junction resolvasome RuvABC ATP-dependent DNA helicase subunit
VKINVDPRLLVQYTNAAELVGIDEVRDEVIKILVERKEVCRQQDKIVSIVGFGGLGKTTLANAVYQKLRAQFDCSAFVSVTQNPEMDKLFQDLFYQLAKRNNSRINVIDEISEFLQSKRYGGSTICTKAWFTSHANPKYFLFHPSHRIFRRMHRALNVGKKDN